MKLKSFVFLLAGMLVASCSDDYSANNVVSPESPNGETGKVVFNLSVKDKLHLASRASASPIYSQEPNLDYVTNVKVYAFLQSGSDYLFTDEFVVPWGDAVGNSLNYYIPQNDWLAIGTYKFLAVARETTDAYLLPTLTPEVTNYNDMIASINTAGNEYQIFSATADQAIVKGTNSVSMTMERKVAGVMGYFTNIPDTVDNREVASLRLSVSATSWGVNLGTGAGTSAHAGTYNIMDIDLTQQAVTGGVYAGNTVPSSVVKVDNAQLEGAYLLPETGVVMTLGLYDASNAPIREWVVKNEVGVSPFDIAANNFYSLGTKQIMDETTGKNGVDEDDNDPSSDDDNAIDIDDLMQSQSIMLSLNPDWTEIHDLTAE